MSTTKDNALVKQIMRFVSKDGMNIPTFTRKKLMDLVEAGYLKSAADLYKLNLYKTEITKIEGFNTHDFDFMWFRINESKAVNFENFLVALNIPNVGLAEGQAISNHFKGEITKFEEAITDSDDPFDFSTLEGFNETVNSSIYKWFGNVANTNLWCDLKKIISFRIPAPSGKGIVSTTGIYGKRVVITGTLRGYTRFEGNQLVNLNGGISQDRVTKNTDFLVIATNPGRKKIEDADKYGITTITESEFMSMIK